MSAAEAFTYIEGIEGQEPQLYDDFQKSWSGVGIDIDVQLVTALKKKHPEMIVTAVPATNVNLLQFANAGFATAALDLQTEPVARWRGYIAPPPKGGVGALTDATFFARYNYKWNDEYFILYTVLTNVGTLQYILKEPRDAEVVTSHSAVTDALLLAIGGWLTRPIDGIWVYDGYWRKDVKLWQQVKDSSWKDVILNDKTKKNLKEVSEKFFDSKDIYDEYGVPWKRGVIFHGPVGNGKTITIKALMRNLIEKKINVLYVKHAAYTYNIQQVFHQARQLTPCMLVLEDIDTIVTSQTRSYFFNEVDGLENNDGILMVATTNHLDALDPGLSKRPSRFDRKYLFPLPSFEERTLYCEYWRNKLKEKPIEFPKKLTSAIAKITDDFSFAYLKEAFVATLLELARNREKDDEDEDETEHSSEEGGHNDLNNYELWRVMKSTVRTLREDMDAGTDSDGNASLNQALNLGMTHGIPPRGAGGPSEQPKHYKNVQHAFANMFDTLAVTEESDKRNAVEWGL